MVFLGEYRATDASEAADANGVEAKLI